MTECRIKECRKAAMPRRTVCTTHHRRIQRHGDPMIAKAPLDQIAVDIAIEMRHPLPGMTHYELRAAGIDLAGRMDATAQQVADQMGVSVRSVYRWRAAARIKERQAA